jgi:hypothetical protein
MIKKNVFIKIIKGFPQGIRMCMIRNRRIGIKLILGMEILLIVIEKQSQITTNSLLLSIVHLI